MGNMSKEVYKSKKALPNKTLNEDGTITDLLGNTVIGTVAEYENKPALPNKWLNPDGSYSTFADLIGGSVDTELFIVVEELPEKGQDNKIYLLAKDDGKIIEYTWTNNKWNPIGMVEFDINNYYTKDQITQLISSTLTSAKDYADGKANSAETNAKAYADTVAESAETSAKGYADTQAGAAETAAKAYADNVGSSAVSSANGYTDTQIQQKITQVLGGSY